MVVPQYFNSSMLSKNNDDDYDDEDHDNDNTHPLPHLN
jgi:hypothetical protein